MMLSESAIEILLVLTKGLMHMTRRTTPRSLFLVVVATWSHRKEGPVVILESHERGWNLMEKKTFPVPFRLS